MNNDELTVPHLIRIGITHYQFETIHPFLDGFLQIQPLLFAENELSANIKIHTCSNWGLRTLISKR